ncbi:MAG: hypothetical protein AAFX76_13770, partial [Planctomycetota bacterium]
MPRSASSRTRYADYKSRVRRRRAESAPRDKRGQKIDRTRGFGQLLAAFWGILGEHRGVLAAALTTLTLSTLIGLAPLYAPKIVVDSVLGDEPLSPLVDRVLPVGPEQPKTLLLLLVGV